MTFGSSSFGWIEFDKNGTLKSPEMATSLEAAIARPEIRELVVLAHGWNNDRRVAEELYSTLWKNAVDALTGMGRDAGIYALAGVLWPAKTYDAQYDGAGGFRDAPNQNGTKAIAASTVAERIDAPKEHLERMIEQVRAFADAANFDLVADAARSAAGSYKDGTAYDFFKKTMAILGYGRGGDDLELQQDAQLFRDTATRDGADSLIEKFTQPIIVDLAPDVGKAQGLSDTVQTVFSGPRTAVIWILNKLTYYTMKQRAGFVGQGLADVLANLEPNRDVRLHLVGHSFGGRLVTSAAAAYSNPAHLELRSMTLLQAAYSHNGLTKGKGPFANIIGKASGPISFTHTHNDKACTIAYPIASRLNGDTVQALGDKNDVYGAMGANGPQLTGTMMGSDCQTTEFAPVPGKITRFLADSYIVKTPSSDAHNNVTNVQCGRLLAATLIA